MKLTIKPDLRPRIEKLRDLASRGIYEGIGRLAPRAGDILLAALQEEAPVSPGEGVLARKGGTLRDSIHYLQFASNSGITLEYRAVGYAEFVIKGTAPHDIYPRSPGGVLAFYTLDGDLVFTRHVHHPGTSPNDFPARAWAKAEPEIAAMFSETGRELVWQALN